MNHALVVDSDLKTVRLSASSEFPFPVRPPILAKTAVEGIRLLRDPQIDFGAVCLNPVLCAPGGIALIRFAHEHRPGVPIYIVQDTPGLPPLDGHELWRLAIQGVIQKSPDHPNLLEQIQPLALGSLVRRSLDSCQDRSGKAPSDDSHSNEYLPIPIQNFFFHSKTFFDIFIRVAENRFLKILEAGDFFSADRLEGYLRKDVRRLFFKRENHRRCLDYCRVLERTFLHSDKIAPGVKISQTLAQSRDALEALRANQAPTEQHIESILDFNRALHLLIRNLGLQSHVEVSEIFRNVKLYEHSVGTAFVAAMLASSLDIESDLAIDEIGLAAFLHDIGLLRMPPAVQAEDPRRMTASERKLYQEHPRVSAEILRGLPGISDSVITAILGHHERHGDHGFPEKLTSSEINLQAEIVGISDEFVRLIHALPDFSCEGVIGLMSASLLRGFSPAVTQALCELFDPGEKQAAA